MLHSIYWHIFILIQLNLDKTFFIISAEPSVSSQSQLHIPLDYSSLFNKIDFFNKSDL